MLNFADDDIHPVPADLWRLGIAAAAVVSVVRFQGGLCDQMTVNNGFT